ncbi:hypothetical protein K431DRAFT_348452 [Polychaeton citri CBS 116435]|uniref:CSN8/PSMD8/EIF3K domain-containing protein n=1 Tax=Polychaeton citri CBS 116435 TaxID=1314669 RepID=A0A9P4Q318_9PEZI|nr:hypothetical protein K431DRAFT_348452 [Polychaeton citri CBS 116435]
MAQRRPPPHDVGGNKKPNAWQNQPLSSSIYRPPGRRNGPSGAWNRFGERIKPASLDPLDEYQLPSKGERRLHDFRTQEQYFPKIVERYMKFCAASGSGEGLTQAFASLALDKPDQHDARKQPAAIGYKRQDPPQRGLETSSQNDMHTVLMAMRKLREGMLGSRRTDNFAQRAYMLIIHASILARQWESYHHALTYLLYNIHSVTPLTEPEMEEFVGYRILDCACRQNDILQALSIRQAFHHKDWMTFQVVKAVMRNDWVAFWRLKQRVDGYQSALMQFAESHMRTHALKCLGRSYMQADKSFIERSTGSEWTQLQESGVAWQLLENGVVMIRKPKIK